MGVRTEFTECSSRAYKRALNSTVIKTCALCMMASSRLSSQLMLGVEPSTKSAEATQATALVSAGVGAPEDKRDVARAGAGELSNEEGHDEKDINGDKVETSLHWLESNLFSGGLVVDAELKSNIVSRIKGYSRGLGDTGTHSEGEDTEESHDEDDDEDSSYGPGLGSSGTLQSEECDIKSLRYPWSGGLLLFSQ